MQQEGRRINKPPRAIMWHARLAKTHIGLRLYAVRCNNVTCSPSKDSYRPAPLHSQICFCWLSISNNQGFNNINMGLPREKNKTKKKTKTKKKKKKKKKKQTKNKTKKKKKKKKQQQQQQKKTNKTINHGKQPYDGTETISQNSTLKITERLKCKGTEIEVPLSEAQQ